MPQLFSFTRKLKRSINFLLEHQDLDRIFILPLSDQATEQLLELQKLLEDRHLDENVNDKWTYYQGNSGFNTRKVYKHLHGVWEASPLFPWLWSPGNLGKHKFFFWLLLEDRLNTRNLLRRKNKYMDDQTCVLCNNGVEVPFIFYLIVCSLRASYLNIHWNLNLQPLDMIIEARTNFCSIIFREIVITTCQIIWKMRNSIILIMPLATSRF